MKKITKIKMYSVLNKNILLPLFGKKRLISYFYKLKKGKNIDFRNPKTYSEKIQLRKLDENNKLYILCADKYKVRDYVKEKIGEEFLIPFYFAKEQITIDDIKQLPNSFVLKTNNGSGTNFIVFDKQKENISKLVKTMNNYIKIKYGYSMLELFYNKIKRLIIAEELLLENNQVPFDYKFHCFKNKSEYRVIIQVDYDRFSNHSRNFYDENWHLLPFTLGFQSSKKVLDKPKNLKKMIEVSKKLATDFNYVRVDLYNVNNKIYFGELTFTHGSGYEKFNPEKYDEVWGAYWQKGEKK